MAEKEFPPLLARLWDEILLLKSGQSVNLLTQPAQEAKPNLLNIILPSAPQHLDVAFVHGGNAAHSSWVYSHELGRAHLEQVFGSRITTRMAENVSPGPEDVYKRQDGDGTLVYADQTHQHLDGRCFAGAVWAEKSEDFAGLGRCV